MTREWPLNTRQVQRASCHFVTKQKAAFSLPQLQLEREQRFVSSSKRIGMDIVKLFLPL